MDVLASGLGLVESPRWHDGRLWWADWTNGRILMLDDDAGGEIRTVVEHASLPLCFDFLPDGRLLLVSNAARALLTLSTDGTLETYADLSAVAPYGANDIVVDGLGNAWVNSPNFDFATGPPAGEVQPGVVLLVPPGGEAGVVADDLAFPNGMAVSADGRTLVVADSYRHHLVGFTIANRTLTERRVWAVLGDAAPDGICLDADGAAWYADVPHRRCVRVAEGGAVLATVELDRGGFACMLDRATSPSLYAVTAVWPGMAGLGDPGHRWDGQVVRVGVDVRGAGWPGN